MPLYSELPPYAFLKQDARLGISAGLGDSFEQNVQRLEETIKHALSQLEEIRSGSQFRRDFAETHFRNGSGVEHIIGALRA